MSRNKLFIDLTIGIGVLVAASFSVHAQAPGSSRGLSSGEGVHTIQGRVHVPSGQAITVPAKVSLEGVNTVGSMTTATDQDGVFRFRGVAPGSYTIVVDAGDQYDKAREPVTIGPEVSPGGRIVQVAIQLHVKIDASNPAFANIPGAALGFYQKAVAAASKGNRKEAVELLEKAISAHPDFPIALSELGQQYMLSGDMDKARSTFEQLVKFQPNDHAAHLNFGIALFNQKKFGDAESHLREALKLNSSGPSAHYYLGLILISTHHYDEAVKEFELTIKNGGDNLALAHKYLGGLYMSSKKNPEAADELEKYLKLDPKAPDAERIRGTIKDLRNKQ